ncbi:hypothetical protein GCK32_017328 [Trichostrongylus colubriformis]|uniref:Uncharacterized protein n=1 Tax=Trichostrongylus colubriformis TaxID=6319 RepID=A0AAN8IGL8_TRICO
MMYVDRLFDNFCKSYKSAQNYILASLLTVEFPLALFVVVYVFRGAVPTEPLLSCLNVPLSSMVDVSIATAALLPVNCICFVMSVLLFQTHQRKITLSRFDVSRHFKATMNRDALWFMRVTTITQAVIIILYPILVLAVRFTAYKTPRILNKTLATLVYIFNWYCVLVPVVMIHAAKQTRTERRRKIDSVMEKQVFGEEGSDYYFALLRNQWQQEAERKS